MMQNLGPGITKLGKRLVLAAAIARNRGRGLAVWPCHAVYYIFDVLSLGCRVASVGPFFVLAPLRGVLVAPASGSVPSRGAAAVAAEGPTPSISLTS